MVKHDKVFIISSNVIREIISKLKDPVKGVGASADLKKVLEIKQGLLWRANVDSCCGSLSNTAAVLERETTVLGNALNNIKNGNESRAIQMLEDYLPILENNENMLRR